MVNKQIIILKESELIELIKSSVKELQNEQFLVSPILTTSPIYISSSPITVAATSNPLVSTLGSNTSVNWATSLLRFFNSGQKQAISNTWRGAKHYTTKTPGGVVGWAQADILNNTPCPKDELCGLADFFYYLFIECEGWNECTRRGLDAIAIITAFIPGYGQVISIISGLASGFMALEDGAYGEAAFSLTFELFPITRMFKRSGAVNIAEKELVEVIQKMSQKELTQETVEQMSKELSTKQLKFIQNLADQDLKALDKEIMASFNNPANQKMIDDLLGIQWDDVSQITNLNMTRQEFKTMQNTFRTQAEQMGVYDDIISNLNLFKRELKFVGVGLGTAIVSSVLVELGVRFFTDEMTEEQTKELKTLTETENMSDEDFISAIQRNPKFMECFFNGALEALLGGCSPMFISWLHGTNPFEVEKGTTNEELWDMWTKKRDKETLKDEVERILRLYWEQENSIGVECKKKAWDKVIQCREGINSLIEDLK